MEVCALCGVTPKQTITDSLDRSVIDAVCAALALALLSCSHLPEKLAHEPSREPPAREARAEAEAAGAPCGMAARLHQVLELTRAQSQ